MSHLRSLQFSQQHLPTAPPTPLLSVVTHPSSRCFRYPQLFISTPSSPIAATTHSIVATSDISKTTHLHIPFPPTLLPQCEYPSPFTMPVSVCTRAPHVQNSQPPTEHSLSNITLTVAVMPPPSPPFATATRPFLLTPPLTPQLPYAHSPNRELATGTDFGV